MKRQTSGGRSVRLLRVGETVRHALAQILARDEIADPDLAGVSVTVAQVTVSPDLRQATVYVAPLGGRDQDAVVAALNRHAGLVRGALGRAVHLKYLPRLTFRSDASFDEAQRVNDLLGDPRVRRDLSGGHAGDEG